MSDHSSKPISSTSVDQRAPADRDPPASEDRDPPASADRDPPADPSSVEHLYEKCRKIADTGNLIEDDVIIVTEVSRELTRRQSNFQLTEETKPRSASCLMKWPGYLQCEPSELLIQLLHKLCPNLAVAFEYKSALNAPIVVFPVFSSGVSTNPGLSSSVEDTYLCLEDFVQKYGLMQRSNALYGVFCGQGNRDAAEFWHNNLPNLIFDNGDFEGDLENSINDAFKRMRILAYTKGSKIGGSAILGTSALTVCFLGRCVVVASNNSNCKAILCRADMALALSIVGVGESSELPAELPENSNQLVRYVEYLELKESDKFLILSQSLWEVFGEQEAVDWVLEELAQNHDAEECSKSLMEEALKRKMKGSVTVAVVRFESVSAPTLQDYLGEEEAWFDDCVEGFWDC